MAMPVSVWLISLKSGLRMRTNKHKTGRKLKVLQFTVAATMGGRTQYILNLWNHIDHDAFTFDFVTFSKESDFNVRLDVGDGEVFYVNNYPEIARDSFISEFNAILRKGYDIIEIHTSYWKDTIVEEMARKVGIKAIIIHGHSTGITQITRQTIEDEGKLIQRHNEVKQRIGNELATCFWACSEECADWLFRPIISEKNIRIIPNPIDVSRYRFNREVRRVGRCAENLDDVFVFGYVGRLEPAKNLLFLLDRFDAVAGHGGGIKLVIVGDGSERKVIEDSVKARELEQIVKFVGHTNDTSYYYQLMDCFLLPSLFEGYPLAAMEAQCSGLRCIMSDNIPETVCLTDNCQRIPLSRVDLWEEEMRMAATGYERTDECLKIMVERGLDIRTAAKRMEMLYRKELQ